MKVNNPNNPIFPVKVISKENENEVKRYLSSIGWELGGGDTVNDFPYYFKNFKEYDKKYYWDWEI
jgi:hypothetical protein